SRLAADQQAARTDRSAWFRAARAARSLSGIYHPRQIPFFRGARTSGKALHRGRLCPSMKARSRKIAALAGGVGASKLLFGLYDVLPDPTLLTAIVNTGDDIVLHGLRISPDLDIVTYTLAGVIDPKKGWGFRNETFHLLNRLAVFGRASWFNLGDRDLATHIHRTALLAEGKTLSDAADSIRAALGVKARILPTCNEPVPTTIVSNQGALHFQEYLVQRRA